ncbi:MAG: hypothetical protein ACOVJ5_00075 [Gloeomargaritales cyanobacterium]
MRHVSKALAKYQIKEEVTSFIKIENEDDIKGIAPIVSFTIQSDPISEVGLNGVQALDMLKYVKYLFESLNDTFPCRENSLTITKIEEAIHWQDARTKDRQSRLVEGTNNA